MRPKAYSSREFLKLLKDNNYYFERHGKGSHDIYSNGINHISIKLPINKVLALRLIKENHLKASAQ